MAARGTRRSGSECRSSARCRSTWRFAKSRMPVFPWSRPSPTVPMPKSIATSPPRCTINSKAAALAAPPRRSSSRRKAARHIGISISRSSRPAADGQRTFFAIAASYWATYPISTCSGRGYVPNLLELRARIANDFGDRAEAMQIGLHFFQVGVARIRCDIDQKTNFLERHFDFLEQLRAATVESRLGVNRHGLEFDPVFLRAFVGDDIGAGDQCSHHRFGGRRAHVGAFALFGFIDDRLDIAYGNFRARMGGTVTPNTLRDSGLLSHNNHDVAPVVSLGG